MAPPKARASGRLKVEIQIMKRISKHVAFSVVGSVIAAIMVLTPAWAESEAESAALPLPSISVMVAQKKSIAEELMITGSFAAGANVQVAPLVSGLAVTEILVEEGDEVKEGQILARLDPVDIELQLTQNSASLVRNDADISQAKNRIEQAKIKKEQALGDLNRTKKLRSTGLSTSEQFDQRRAAYDLATAELAEAELSLTSSQADRLSIEASKKELELRKSRTEIRAPVEGYISKRLVEHGMISNPGGGSMFNLVAKSVVKLVAEVAESDLPKVQVGQKASIAVNGYREALGGTVRLISPEVDPATRMGKVHIRLSDGIRVPLGAFGRATIWFAKGEGVSLPLTAVTFGADGPTVQVVKDRKVQVRNVATGRLGTTEIEITEGIEPGETFVVRAGSFVRNGDLVNPVVISELK